MSFYRSQVMGYYSLVVPRESAWEIINTLGDYNCLHFVDHDPDLPLINRPFANYIKRCDEVYHKIELIEQRLVLFEKQIFYPDDVQDLIRFYQKTLSQRDLASHTYFDQIEQEVEKMSAQLAQQIVVLTNLVGEKNTLIERKAVLQKGNIMLGQSYFQYYFEFIKRKSDPGEDTISKNMEALRFNTIVGVVNKEDELRFKRTVFRITKGNAFVSIVDIVQSDTQEALINVENVYMLINIQKQVIMRCVFVVVFQGDDDVNLQTMKGKLQRIISAFSATIYNFPQSQNWFEIELKEIETNLKETKNLIALTKDQIEYFLESYSALQTDSKCSLVQQLKLYVLREKYLYNTLNLMKMQGSVFCGYFWMPESYSQMIQQAIRQAQKQDNMPSGQIQVHDPPEGQSPPTHFRLNDVTWVFQEIVNTYGIPRYQEVNPGLFTVTTFPFLFAVMYGDIGHGGLLLALGIYLVYFQNFIKTSDSIFKPLLGARHMILMMGFFAFYIGWIYNDFLSLAINTFGSCYVVEGDAWQKKEDNCTYLFGIDPAWRVATNELNFVNSYKMKLAVIIGVAHMSFGIIMKGVNSIFFKQPLDFFCEFLPQIIFMICTFGYMDFLIIFKWLNVYEPELAPSIISTLIGMALTPLQIPPFPLWGDGVSQRNLSIVLLLTAIICVPLMLFPKPYILNSMYEKKKYQQATDTKKSPKSSQSQSIKEQNEGELLDEPLIIKPDNQESILFAKDLQKATTEQDIVLHKQQDNHSSSEIFVHQVIETIEFVLGSISNTASYLRLWALSLAHGQLAEVFYDMTLAGGIEHGGMVGIFTVIFGFILFSMITLGVLMLMDVMECFLHALRLHWVEFQNKFYKADGHMFTPFSYSKLLKQHNEPPL